MPLPATGSVYGDPGPLLAKLMDPLTAPAVVGANCTVNPTLCPAMIVVGRERPLSAIPFPRTVAKFTTRSALPLLVNCALCVLVWPTATFPKFSDVGETVRRGPLPLPLSETESSGFEALLATEKLPVTSPTDCGAN